MRDLRQTLPGGFGLKPHKHIVFLDTGRMLGMCSTEEGHDHPLKYIPAVPAQEEIPPTEAQYDAEGLEIAPANPGQAAVEGQPERWEMGPGADGHNHVDETGQFIALEIERKNPQKAMDDAEIIREVHTYFKSAWEQEYDSYQKMLVSEDFYMGKQWTDEEKKYLAERDRACLTINDTAKEINKLAGHQAQSKTDFKLQPVGGTDQGVCDIGNVVIKNITEQCYYEREEAKVFLDGIIGGRGNFNMYVDKMRNPEGDIKIERFSPKDVRYGEHEKEDLEDCEFLVKDKMYSLGRLKAMYEDFEDELDATFTNMDELKAILAPNEDSSKDPYTQGTETPVTLLSGEIKIIDVERKELRVMELWRKRFIKVPVIVNAGVNFYFDGYGISKAAIKSIKTMKDFYVVERVVPKIVLARVCGMSILEYQNPANLPADDFFMVPFYCNKRNGEYWGKIEDIKDLQREVNKRHSQSVDIGNKCAGYGYVYDSQTFANKKDEDNFLKNRSSAGFAIKVQDAANPPKEIVGGEFPAVISQLLTLSHQNIAELMNITVNPNGANESNSMFTYRQKLLFAGNQYVMDNLKFAKTQLGRLLVKVIQDIYTAERIWDILVDENSKTEGGLQIGGQPFTNYAFEDIERLLNDNDLTKTQVIVTEGVYSPSIRMSIFAILAELKQGGADVPLELLFEFADLPKDVKDKVLVQLAQAAEAAGVEQKDKNATELIKTAMGKGQQMPPDVMKRFAELIGVMGTTPAQPSQPSGLSA